MQQNPNYLPDRETSVRDVSVHFPSFTIPAHSWENNLFIMYSDVFLEGVSAVDITFDPRSIPDIPKYGIQCLIEEGRLLFIAAGGVPPRDLYVKSVDIHNHLYKERLYDKYDYEEFNQGRKSE
ncbi:hypothetical protein [Diplocloster hominis]|uniref:hypothetical protein n=1 Tax=Diplocloster hominis TaxID=3079010 RepID=UPI0031BA4888